MNNAAIVLEVQGLGHVPSFKNTKMLTKGRLITEPRKRKWMDQCTRSFASQLWSALVTAEDATSTGRRPPCWTASLPLDDSWQWIPEIKVLARKVKRGDEGATVLVERLP